MTKTKRLLRLTARTIAQQKGSDRYFLLKNTFLGLVSMFLKREKSLADPLYIQLETTTFCNLNCVMCDQNLIKKKKHMSLADFKKILKKMPNLLALDLTGMGENLLNKDFLKILAHAKEKKKFVAFTCNFTLLDRKKAKKIVELGVDEIVVSLDSADKKSFEKIRVGANFDKVIENIKGLIKVRHLMSKKLPEIQIRCVTMRQNIGHLKKMINLAASLGVETLHVTTVYGPDKKRPKHFSNLELQKRAQRFVDYAKKKKVRLQLGSYHKKPICDCPLPFIHFYVTVEGWVLPCCYAQQSGSYEEFIQKENMGNILDDSLENIWNSSKYQSFRRAIKKGPAPKLCRQCPIYKQ